MVFDFIDDIHGWIGTSLKNEVDQKIASDPNFSMEDVHPEIIALIEKYTGNPDAPKEAEVSETAPSQFRHIVKEFGEFLIKASEGPASPAKTEDLIQLPSKLDTQVCETFETAVGNANTGEATPENDLKIPDPVLGSNT